jgi:hypothetical protein
VVVKFGPGFPGSKFFTARNLSGQIILSQETLAQKVVGLILGANSAPLCNLIANTAGEGVKLHYEKMNVVIELDTSCYVILKGIQYKTGNPMIMLISTQNCMLKDTRKSFCDDAKICKNSMLPKKNDSFPDHQNNFKTADKETVLLSESKAPEDDSSRLILRSQNDGLTVKKGFLIASESELTSSPTYNQEVLVANTIISDDISMIPLKNKMKNVDSKSSSPSKNDLTTAPKHNQKLITPNYEIIEKEDIELIDSNVSTGLKQQCATRPKYIEYRIHLPSIKSAKLIELDVNKQHLVMSSSKYYLCIPHPYPVLSNDGKAKYDVVLSKLIILLPVQRSKHIEEGILREKQDNGYYSENNKLCPGVFLTHDSHCHVASIVDEKTCGGKGDIEVSFTCPVPKTASHTRWLDRSSVFALSKEDSSTMQTAKTVRIDLATTQKLPQLQMIKNNSTFEDDDNNEKNRLELHGYENSMQNQQYCVDDKKPCTNTLNYSYANSVTAFGGTNQLLPEENEIRSTTAERVATIHEDELPNHYYFENNIMFDMD